MQRLSTFSTSFPFFTAGREYCKRHICLPAQRMSWGLAVMKDLYWLRHCQFGENLLGLQKLVLEPRSGAPGLLLATEPLRSAGLSLPPPGNTPRLTVYLSKKYTWRSQLDDISIVGHTELTQTWSLLSTLGKTIGTEINQDGCLGMLGTFRALNPALGSWALRKITPKI